MSVADLDKAKIVADYQRAKNDTGSPEVQVALLTARINDLTFPELRGSLRWLPDRFDVTKASAAFEGGRTRFDYGIAPLGRPGQRPRATFNTEYDSVDLALIWDAVQTDIPALRASLIDHLPRRS